MVVSTVMSLGRSAWQRPQRWPLRDPPVSRAHPLPFGDNMGERQAEEHHHAGWASDWTNRAVPSLESIPIGQACRKRFISTILRESGKGCRLRLWIRTFDTLHLALPLLLSVSLLVGPPGLAASAALVSMRACGVWCPCEEGQHGRQAALVADAHPDCDGSHEAAQCDKAPCPDECPDCDCCPGLMCGLLPVVLSSLPAPTSSPELRTFSDTPAYGEVSGIFRPPRCLT